MKTCLYSTVACCCFLFSFSAAFSPSAISRPRAADFSSPQNCADTEATRHVHHTLAVPRGSTRLYDLPEGDLDKDDKDDLDNDHAFDAENFDPAMAAQIKKAKQLIDDMKKKQKSQEEAAAAAAAVEGAAAGSEDDLAESKAENDEAKLPFFATKSKIKSKNESGDIIADGETMASLSASEPWEQRSLSQMFEREDREDFDGNVVPATTDARTIADRDMAAGIFGLRRKLQTEDFFKVFNPRNRFIGDLD